MPLSAVKKCQLAVRGRVRHGQPIRYRGDYGAGICGGFSGGASDDANAILRAWSRSSLPSLLVIWFQQGWAV